MVDSQSLKSTAVGAEDRGYDGAKKVKGLKSVICSGGYGRLRAQGEGPHSAKVMDYEGIKTLLRGADRQFARLSHLWLDAGYSGEDKGAHWVQKTLGWSMDLLERARMPAPKEVLMRWAREWAKEGVKVDWEHLLPPKGIQILPRRWVVERTFSWIEQNRRMSLGITRGYLRAAKRVGICCYDSPHEEAIDPPLRPFHTVSEGEFSEVRMEHPAPVS